jgi:hypothetical protein
MATAIWIPDRFSNGCPVKNTTKLDRFINKRVIKIIFL